MDDDNRGISFFYLFFASFFSFFFLRGKRKKEGREGKAPSRVCPAYHLSTFRHTKRHPLGSVSLLISLDALSCSVRSLIIVYSYALGLLADTNMGSASSVPFFALITVVPAI